MTNEEAIEVIEQDIPCEYDTDLIEALEMAIAALKAEPCGDCDKWETDKTACQKCGEPCGDAVSRSAVLDLMRTNWADNDGDTAMQLSIDDVRNLPAATAYKMSAVDAVSRESALKALGELPHEYKTKEQRARTGGIAACQVIVRELPPVTPKPRWIPVSERLPEEEGTYLTITKNNAVRINHFYKKHGLFGYRNNVIAWMPLPEPYKEGDGE